MLIKIYRREIIDLKDDQVIHIGDWFLRNSKKIISLSLNNVITIGTDFVSPDNSLTNISLESVITIGNYFLYNNRNRDKNGELINNRNLYVSKN